jgi:hypothetical protein
LKVTDDVYPGSEFSNPDPGLKGFRIPNPDPPKNLNILTLKIVSKLSKIRSGMYIPDPYL